MRRTIILAMIIMLMMALSGPASAETRIALVIGNGSYRSAPLTNAVNDATDMKTVLERMQFNVIFKKDADKGTMLTALDQFRRELAISDVGLFYFAGHGMQIHGNNYLIPVHTHITSETDVEYAALAAGRVLGKMKDTATRVNIIILDACRDNPFKRSFRTTAQGLVQMNAPTGSILAYATAPGDVAADGSSRNGLYTSHLMKHILTPGITIETVFKRTRNDVMKAAEKMGFKQVPWESSSMTGDFYFASGTALGSLQIFSQPSGARITLNNKYKGKTPLIITDLSPDTYLISGTLPGHHRVPEKQVKINKGSRSIITLYFSPENEKKQARALSSAQKSPFTFLIIIVGGVLILILAGGIYFIRRYVQSSSSRIPKSPPPSSVPSTYSSSSTSSNRKEGTVWKEPVTDMEFVWVPGGCFQMGQTEAEKAYLIKERGQENYDKFYDDELPRHRVCVDGFWMGKCEVTRGQFRQFIKATGYPTDADKKGTAWIFNKETDWKWKEKKGYNWEKTGYEQTDRHPVVNVSWNDAVAFVQWLNRNSSHEFALPTEAQWEYACRGGSDAMRFWGDDEKTACRYANVADKGHNWSSSFPCDDGYKFTAPVGHFQPNNFGLYDMLGNVWEWCQDIYANDAYKHHDTHNPIYTRGGPPRVRRGGGWYGTPTNVRCAYRYWNSPGYRNFYLGFRLLRAD